MAGGNVGLESAELKENERIQELQSQEQVSEQVRRSEKELTARLNNALLEQEELVEYIGQLTGEPVTPSTPGQESELADLREKLERSASKASRANQRLAGIEWKLQLREDRISELEEQVIHLSGLLAKADHPGKRAATRLAVTSA